MIVEKVELNNFRNYLNQEIKFKDGINVIYGDNAQGKTNLVEALYFCSIGKTFKSCKEKDLIRFSSETAQIKLEVKKNIGKIKIETNIFKTQKKVIKVNGGYLNKVADLYGNLVTVFFSPNDLKLVKDAPGDRRKFLDVSISQLSRKYLLLLIKYQQIMDERNALLKSKISVEEMLPQIDIWNRYISKVAKDIITQRAKYVAMLNEYASKVHRYLTDGEENLEVSYQTQADTIENCENEIYQKLKESFEKDYQVGFTQTGPHRDDLKLIVNGIDIKTFGSQGQQRSVALSLKLAEKEILKDKLGEYPILILDDVFSELDENRVERLLKLLKNGQTFITTTEEISASVGNIIKIKDGKVVKGEN